MAIISVSQLDAQLPSDANDDNGDITDAVNRSSGFINTWTSRHYDSWDDYDSTASAVRAPEEIVYQCLEVGKAMYFQGIGQNTRNGEEVAFWKDMIESYKAELQIIKVAPTWEEQTISLNSNNAMIIGNRNGGGTWTRVLPFRSNVVSDASNVWTLPGDWIICEGGRYDDEYRDAWYFYAESSSVEGTLRYMRTYRNDSLDYATYMGQ